jgi:hypothetical protein
MDEPISSMNSVLMIFGSAVQTCSDGAHTLETSQPAGYCLERGSLWTRWALIVA